MTDAFLHKKSLGQHFLTSDIVPMWLCDAANISSEDTVLEIGPGSGVLTKELLKRGARVVAVETDKRAVALLEEMFAREVTSEQLTLLTQDARQLDTTNIQGLVDHQFKVVANIPYYLSGHLLRCCIQTSCQPSDLVFLVQKEVAKRAAATAKHSLLSLSVQVYGDVSYVKTVSRGHFHPAPKVDSGILAVRNISRDRFQRVDESHFFALARLGFAQKRKQLLGNLAAAYDRALLQKVFTTCELQLDVRAEDVSIEQWFTLAECLQDTTSL